MAVIETELVKNPKITVQVDNTTNTFTIIINISSYTNSLDDVRIVLEKQQMMALLEFYYSNSKSELVETLVRNRIDEIVTDTMAKIQEANRPTLVRRTLESDFT